MVSNLPANAGVIREADSISGLGRSPGVGNSNPLQYSCLEHPMDRGVWWATVHRVAKSWTKLKRLRCSNIVPSDWLVLLNIIPLISAHGIDLYVSIVISFSLLSDIDITIYLLKDI